MARIRKDKGSKSTINEVSIHAKLKGKKPDKNQNGLSKDQVLALGGDEQDYNLVKDVRDVESDRNIEEDVREYSDTCAAFISPISIYITAGLVKRRLQIHERPQTRWSSTKCGRFRGTFAVARRETDQEKEDPCSNKKGDKSGR